MLTTWEKTKLSLFGWVKGKDGFSLTERTLNMAARTGDMETLRFLKSKGVSEYIGRRHILEYADVQGIRQMMDMGYGAELDDGKKKSIVLNGLLADRRAFTDSQTIPFCRKLGISMGMKDKSGNNILLRGQSRESVEGWAAQAHIAQVAEEFVAAAARNDVDMMRILNRTGRVNLETRIKGKTAIYRAIENGQERASDWLLRHRAKIDILDSDGNSALKTERGKALAPKLLSLAVRYNLSDAATALLNAGVSASDPNLMRMAAENNNPALLDLLHTRGASAVEASSDYERRLDNLTRHETYDEKDFQKIRTTLGLLRKYANDHQ